MLLQMPSLPVGAAEPELFLDSSARPRAEWFHDMWQHREVLLMLARSAFQAQYKRTSFGVAWAVAVPLVQAAVITFIFSHLIRVTTTRDFAVLVLSGMLCWNYFALSISAGSTAIVDGAGMTDKVWFPRALLPAIAPLANVAALLISMVILVAALPFLGAHYGLNLLLLPVACITLITFTTALAFCLSALHVYFRDVRFLLQAALVVWFYVTPVAYPKELLGKLSFLVDLNPMTGVVTLFRLATVGANDWVSPVLITVVVTVVLLVIGTEAQRRHDRLFVDLL